MCKLVVCSKISNMNDLKTEISRHIWRKEGEFDVDMILNDIKETPITIPNCTDKLIVDTIRVVIKGFISTGHIIADDGKYTYI